MRNATVIRWAGGLLTLAGVGKLGGIQRLLDFVGLGGLKDDAATLWGWLMTDYFWWAVLIVGLAALVYGFFFERINRWWAEQNHPLLPLNNPCIQIEGVALTGSKRSDASIYEATYKLLVVNRAKETTVNNLRANLFHMGFAGALKTENGDHSVSLAPGEPVFFEVGTTLHPITKHRGFMVGVKTIADDVLQQKEIMIRNESFYFEANGPRGVFAVGGRIGGTQDSEPSVWPIQVQLIGDNMKPLRLSFDVTPTLDGDTVKLTATSFE